MAFKPDPNSTPKLTLSKLPFCNPRDHPPPYMQTPPLRPAVSIPFHWEEAPGKPRPAAEGSGMPPAKCLELPPRLLHEEAKITRMPSSPISVLDVGRSMSLACTFSFRKGVEAKRSGPRKLGSGRWGSERKFGGGSFGSSQSLGDIFRREDDDVKKIKRVGRRRFISLWGDIYASFKQAVSRRRR